MSGKVRDGRSRGKSSGDGGPPDDAGPDCRPPAGAARSAACDDAAPDRDDVGIRRLSTAAMMADVLGVPPAAVRHWVREGLLAPARRAGSIEWFDFGQLVVGRHLARLLAGGLSLREIDAKLAGLAAGNGPEPGGLVDRVVADGRRLSLRQDGRLLAAGGQLQLPFYTAAIDAEDLPHPATIEPLVVPLPTPRAAPAAQADPLDREIAEILDLADDLEAAGEFVEAAEALRAVLQARGPDPQVNFMLAELLYRAGDLTAARERYYATIEIDADHLRARTSLGCVLAELGDHELALAALEGVLRQAPEYADAHWHVAGVLTDAGRPREARRHLDTFLALAPESPWAAVARQRLETVRT
jgi:DNA-binding transcriptional MerR regulator